MEYEELMKKITNEKKSGKGDRFEPPEIDVIQQGQKTIINADKLMKYINRPMTHLSKFLMHELTAPGQIDENSRIIIGGKFSRRVVQEKINQYIKEYVICKQCGSTDTKMEKVDKNDIIRCLGCGAEYPVGRVR